MVAKARFSTILVLLCLAVLLLQSGCNVSDDAGDPGGGQPSDTIRLTPSTPGDVRALVADGQDSIPVRVTVTDNTGNGRAGVPVTFVTTAGTLSQAPAAPGAGRANSPEDPIAVPQQEAGEPLTVNTNANGVAEVILTSSTRAETAVVTASVPAGFRTSIRIAFIFPVAEVEVRAMPPEVVREDTATIEASVTGENNQPIASETVTFTVSNNISGATLSPTTAMTDDRGRASVTYTAGTTFGVDTITASTSDGTRGTVDVTVGRPEVAAVTASVVGNARIVADGTSSARVRATVTDAGEAGIPGVEVTFATTAGALVTDSATTNDQGIATVDLRSATRIGTADVTASAAGVLSAPVTVTFIAGPPDTVSLSATLTTVRVGETTDITATVVDANSNPTSGVTLTLSVPTNASGGTLSSTTGTTDVNGRLMVTYMAGGTAGTDVIRAETTNGVVGTVSITVNTTGPGGQVGAITVTAGATSIVADGTSSTGIQATVEDTEGNGLAGITVTFTTTAGSLPTPPTAATDETGTARIRLTSATNLGTARVTATAQGFSASTTVMFVAGQPATVLLQANPRFLDAEDESEITATVMDANDNPIASETLTFSLPTNTSGATLTPSTGTTDANGRVIVTYIAGGTPGVDTIQAETTNGRQGMVTITVNPGAVAGRIDLLISSPQLDSDDSERVTLTALVRDVNNNVVEGVEVAFAASSGAVMVQRGTTDTTGTATAVLRTGGDPANRDIRVTARTRTGNLPPSTNAVTVSGTTVTLSGANAAVLGDEVELSLLLRDSSGAGIPNATIMIESAQDNPLSAATVTTDTNGQATVTVTVAMPANDTITATALGATDTFDIAVNTDNFVFTAPVPTPPATTILIPLGARRNVTVHWDDAGTPQRGETINFFATRGTLSPTSAVTNNAGNATVSISATNAGPAVITAVSTVPGGPSSQLEVTFIATDPESLILQAEPTTLGVNRSGGTDQQSLITATVRDPDGNPVQSQTVLFNITEDTSGGLIDPSSARTDSFGRATAVYTAGESPTAQDGVVIDAMVEGTTDCDPTVPIPTGPCDRVTLTVAQQALFIRLGTGNMISVSSDTTRYIQPYSVLVTDVLGNAVSGATVELNVTPTRYQKGFYTLVFDTAGGCIGWGKDLTINPLNGGDDSDQACNNEDINGNGILEDEDDNNNGRLDPGEDNNGNNILDDEDNNDNGLLDPGNVAAVPASGATDASGFFSFNVEYAREFTWVEIRLEARGSVAGSEALSQAIYFLPGLADDFNDCLVAPPGLISPYGTALTCECDERPNPNRPVPPFCPTRNPLTPVTVTPPSVVLFSDRGGTVEFTVSGGSESSYLLSSTGGTLNTSRVNFGESFMLEVPPRLGGDFIIVTATDVVTRQEGEEEVRLILPPPIVIAPFISSLAATGGEVSFTISGGSGTAYTVVTDSGTLRNEDGTQSGSSIAVVAGESFTLEVPPNTTTDDLTITLTATDDDTGQAGTATVTQLALPPVEIRPPDPEPANPGGDVIRFNVLGGTQMVYIVSADGGTLMNTTTGASGRTISLNFGQVFLLVVPPNTTSETVTITLIARDNNPDGLTLPAGTATVTQEAP